MNYVKAKMQVAKKRIHIRSVEGFCSLNICKNKILLFEVSEKSFEATKESYVQSRFIKNSKLVS